MVDKLNKTYLKPVLFQSNESEKIIKYYYKNYNLSNMKLKGRLQYKPKRKIGATIELSDDCEMFLKVISKTDCIYEIEIYNRYSEFPETSSNDNGYEQLWSTKNYKIISDYSFKSGCQQSLSCIFWETEKEYLIFYIFNDRDNDNYKSYVYNILALMIYSNNEEKDLDKIINNLNSEVLKEAKFYINNIGYVRNLPEFIEENYKKFSSYSDNDNVDIDKINKQIEEMCLESEHIYKDNDYYNLDKCENILAKEGLEDLEGCLLCYNNNSSKLDMVSDKCYISIRKIGQYKYALVVYKGSLKFEERSNNIFSYKIINFSINLTLNKDKNFILWIGENKQKISACYSFLFSKDNSALKISKIINKLCLEVSNKQSSYINNNNSNEDDCLDNSINNMDIDFIINNEHTSSKSKYKSSYYQDDIKNKFSIQTNKDYMLVLKDDNTIECLRENNYNDLVKFGTTSAIKLNNKELDISKAKMMDNDNVLVLDNSNNALYSYDINKEKIAHEIKPSKDIGLIKEYCNEKKFGNLDGSNNNIFAVSDKNIALIDPRIHNKTNSVLREYSKSSNPNFSCIATNNKEGNFVIGSNDGKIRLYKKANYKPTCRATSVISFTKEPVLAVDISKDGNMLVATYKNYLALIQTFSHKEGSKVSAFNNSIGSELKIIKLTISPIDMQEYNLLNHPYNEAKFDVGNKDDENFVITSIYNYIVIWDINKVLKGSDECYTIKQMDDYIIGNDFNFNKPDIFVTMNSKFGYEKELDED